MVNQVKKTVFTNLPPAIIEKLESEANRRGITRAELLRLLVYEKVEGFGMGVKNAG
jgi:hypothetical protein